MNGSLVTLKKNQRFVPNATVPTGKSQEYGKDAINIIVDRSGKIYDNTLSCFSISVLTSVSGKE